MSLRLIYGRAGTGKSRYCFEEIKKRIGKDTIYMVTPEQFSYTAERKLLDTLCSKAVIQTEVLTFERMAYRVMQELGGTTKIHLSKTGKAMLIYSILEKQKQELTFLGKSNETVEMIANAITEFKKHGIGVQDVKHTIEQTQDQYLKIKLQDLDKLYEKYQENMVNKCIDEEDTLSILIEQLPKTQLFKNAVIYIDEFIGFTKQEQEILRFLLKTAKELNITICTDTLQELPQREKDLFYTGKETAHQILEIARQEHIPIKEDSILTTPYRFHQEELLHLEKNINLIQPQKYEKEIQHIELFLAKNPFSEVEQVARNIVKLVREQGYAYHDIAVVTRNLEMYSHLAKIIFPMYEIPLFLDEKKELSQSILIKYVLAVLDIFSQSWSYEAMFSYLKTGLCSLPQEDVFLLESYCLKWGIKGRKWYQEEWKIATSQEELEKVESLRKQVVEPLLKFKEKLNRMKSATEISKAIYEFLIENEIDKKLEEKAERLEEVGNIEQAKEVLQSWDILMEVLDEITFVLQEDTISFEMYRNSLKIGLQYSGLGKIPGTCDQVILGDVERSRTHPVKAVFILGINDGVFPSMRREEGYLNDADRKFLKEQGLELAKGTLENLYEENFNSYKAFSTAEERLYLSYASSDNQGKALRASMLISRLKKIFPKLEEKSDIIKLSEEITTPQATFHTLLQKLKTYQQEKIIEPIWIDVFQWYQQQEWWKPILQEAMKGFCYTNEPVKLNTQNLQRLYGDTLQTSISKLEQYKRCAFSFYLKYGLGISDKTTFQIESLDTGTLMHDVIDCFFDQVKQRQLSLRKMTEEQIEEMISNIVNEKLTLTKNYIFSSTAKYMILTKRLKKVILKSMKYIIQSIIESEFDVLANEVEFKKNATYPPICMTLEDGKKIELTGKIDRIDVAKTPEGNYLRIIDYKSSIKNIDLNEVVAGLQIQLLTYLDAISKVEDVIPAGVLYFNLIDPVIKATRNQTEEEIETEIKKRFKMQGLILADVKVARKMDINLEKGSSTLIPAYIDSNGNLSVKLSSAITKEQFVRLQQYMHHIIKQIAKEILSGNIGLKPYYNTKTKKTPCEYCHYRAICQFQQNQNDYYYITNKDKEVILQEIEKEKIDERI